MSIWRKIEDEEGFPYYFNEATNAKQWDHPKFSELRQRIDDCNYVKYSTYRVALKFRVLQHALYVEEVPLSIIAGVFERHKLGNNESSLTLENCDLEAVLSDIYYASNKKNHTNTDVDYATEMMMNFLYNVYDSQRERNIQVSSAKVLLGILSNCTLLELYRFMFNLCADHNCCITKLRMQSLLLKVAEITKFLHEDSSFGPHLINLSVESCFNNSPGLVGITESTFISWLEKSPQIISWIPLLHRIKSAEPIIHTVKCSSCKTRPLMGLKYQCIKCARYTQCQRCFFTGRTSHSHKLSHSMREYCGNKGNSAEFSYNLIKKMCSFFCPLKVSDSSVSIVQTKSTSPLKNRKSDYSQSAEVLCDIEPLSSPQTQLHVIIRQLELQNRELQQILTIRNHCDKDIRLYLEEYRIHMSGQIQKLKKLKEHFDLADSTTVTDQLDLNHKSIMVPNQYKANVESTPLVTNKGPFHKNASLDFFSPIAQIAEAQEPSQNVFEMEDTNTVMYDIDDISTWIGGVPPASKRNAAELSQTVTLLGKSPVKELHNDLDDALAKLQQILANNFSMDESLGPLENTHLKHAFSEVEGMLTSIIDNVETSRASSVQPVRLKFDENDVMCKRL